jgi:hypothetical protein
MKEVAAVTGTSMGGNVEPLVDGIYLDLDEEIYRADSALGSSDMRKLVDNAATFWWESPMNPQRPKDRDTPATLRGRAMHKMVLEGEAAFSARYMRGRDWMEGAPSSEKAAETKRINAEAEKMGKEVLPSETYDRVVIASAMISKNPKLAPAFTGGLPEISIFWTRDGLRRKARLDYLKPRGIGDLKSIANTRELAFPAACRIAIAQRRMEIQAAHYMEARAMIPQFMAEGRFNPPNAIDLFAFLKKCAAAKEFGWQWVFFQSEGAPVTWSRILSPANPILEVARRALDQAADNYRAFMDKFGPNEMWLILDPPEELDLAEMPAWWGRN